MKLHVAPGGPAFRPLCCIQITRQAAVILHHARLSETLLPVHVHPCFECFEGYATHESTPVALFSKHAGYQSPAPQVPEHVR